ncbi:hypothetical protein TVAG_047160 [Trichomonas vaginalis G3]|uniref:DUF3447 domain-containing protein n=1 Tax=Trichomonas vaginalis (strain ATCC PRA-98 / G3) TaxID=412133 RepID=A2FHI3_TRIV3|nr:spectrin binding [Trichomonas vaginalis G3]EAX95618.1 hypothetical protein TVAG_047160 [Trichomonas vaginalis G3]KAI5487450.1 spectrin binding [Trichomonas vaginalis G3]|eukprot:XP_001308548.1 hypothetical protein [Trichomonas vaginalis G3]
MENNSPSRYHELLELNKSYVDTFNALYKLNTSNESEIKKICKDIKNNLITTKYFLPMQILRIIAIAAKYNNSYISSYRVIFKRIFETFRHKQVEYGENLFNYFICNECVIGVDSKNTECLDYFIINDQNKKRLEDDTIYNIIMNDNVELLKIYTERKDFKIKQEFYNDFYPFRVDGYSLLELCCYHGSVNCFNFLRTNFHTEITSKCLQLSFLRGNQHIVTECLNVVRPTQECMEYAIASHNIDFVIYLVNEYHLHLDLDLCVYFHNLETFLFYYEITHDTNKCFVKSTYLGIPSLCEYFLSEGASIKSADEFGRTALSISSWSNRKSVVEFLISHGCDVNETNQIGRTALHKAVLNNSKEVINYLISNKANVNSKDNNGETPLYTAVVNNFNTVAVLLIQKKADVNIRDKNNESILCKAVLNNNKELVELLVSKGANVNESRLNKTCLQIATENNYSDIAEFLITHNANANAINMDRMCALLYAIKNNNKEIVELLISNGADVDVCGSEGKTPLHYAAEKDFKEIAEILILHKARIDAFDDDHRTPLHYAAMNNSFETARVLINNGASTVARDKDYINPLEYTRINGNRDLEQLIREYNRINGIDDNTDDDDDDDDDDYGYYDDDDDYGYYDEIYSYNGFPFGLIYNDDDYDDDDDDYY